MPGNDKELVWHSCTSMPFYTMVEIKSRYGKPYIARRDMQTGTCKIVCNKLVAPCTIYSERTRKRKGFAVQWRYLTTSNIRLLMDWGYDLAGNRKRRCKTLHDNASPLMKRFAQILELRQESIDTICRRAGISATAVYQWLKGNNSPQLDLFEAVVNACGYKLQIRKDLEDDEQTCTYRGTENIPEFKPGTFRSHAD